MGIFDRGAPPAEVIRAHPPLVAELVRGMGLDLPAEVDVEVDAEGAAVLRGTSDLLPLTATLGEQSGIWSMTVVRADEVLAEKQLSDGGLDLDDGGPWLVIFGATIGALDLRKKDNRDRVLHAIDDVAPDAHATQRLVADVMRAIPERVRIRLESSMGTMWPPILDFYQDAEDRGYERGTKYSQIATVLMVRGITMTDEQREELHACKDLDELDARLERARLAAAADVFGG